jgi:hypothetical protein
METARTPVSTRTERRTLRAAWDNMLSSLKRWLTAFYVIMKAIQA